ncbi:MAG: hypothetical protein AAB664_03855, partial [Patescibacteria group bacterium]
MNFVTDILQGPLLELWRTTIAYIPNFIGAFIVFLIGLLIATVLQRAVRQIIEILHIDDLSQKLEIKGQFERVGIRLHIGILLGWIVKWFFIIVTLIAATDILGWKDVTDYLKQVVLFVPNVMIAVIILLAGILLANFVQNIVRSAVEAAHLMSAHFLAGMAKWAILIFSFMAALVQLQIAPDL